MNAEIIDMTGWEKGSIHEGTQNFFNKEFEMMIFLKGTTATLAKENEIFLEYRGDGCLGEAINKAKQIHKETIKIN